MNWYRGKRGEVRFVNKHGKSKSFVSSLIEM